MIKKWVITGALAFGLLISLPLSGQAAMGDHTLRPGVWDQDVHELQAKLKAMGFFDFPITTGYYGPVTKQSVLDFQRTKGISVDGIAGNQTFSTIKNNLQSKSMTVSATAYTSECEGCSGVTASGTSLIEYPYAKVIAVDPKVIPMGTVVYVPGYGYAVAADTGGGIKGNEIDVYMKDYSKAVNWGRKTLNISILH
ncbi:3D (Asp-Asp-Asp) domain-containing protein [Fictibacillus barbaricus]|uniref:3D (Asp-Asp-Asp) domain-containing protein n=1 Tax=Fictibacillus barbaricus TaxID=182136 RepID=A0ABU1TVP2_9BACL|nr:3D (Asp-Asp-Asp) domain-containing protein [Fictibacillus barbaricus]